FLEWLLVAPCLTAFTVTEHGDVDTESLSYSFHRLSQHRHFLDRLWPAGGVHFIVHLHEEPASALGMLVVGDHRLLCGVCCGSLTNVVQQLVLVCHVSFVFLRIPWRLAEVNPTADRVDRVSILAHLLGRGG